LSQFYECKTAPGNYQPLQHDNRFELWVHLQAAIIYAIDSGPEVLFKSQDLHRDEIRGRCGWCQLSTQKVDTHFAFPRKDRKITRSANCSKAAQPLSQAVHHSDFGNKNIIIQSAHQDSIPGYHAAPQHILYASVEGTLTDDMARSNFLFLNNVHKFSYLLTYLLVQFCYEIRVNCQIYIKWKPTYSYSVTSCTFIPNSCTACCSLFTCS